MAATRPPANAMPTCTSGRSCTAAAAAAAAGGASKVGDLSAAGPALVGAWTSSAAISPVDLPRTPGAKSWRRSGSSPRTRARRDRRAWRTTGGAWSSRSSVAESYHAARRDREAVADRGDDELLRLLGGVPSQGQQIEDPAGQHLLDRAVEGQRGELGRDVVVEL